MNRFLRRFSVVAIGLSLLANAILLKRVIERRPSASDIQSLAAGIDFPVGLAPSGSGGPAAPKQFPMETVGARELIASLERSDLRPRAVRAIAQAILDDRVERRRRHLEEATFPKEYWRIPPSEAIDPAAYADLRAEARRNGLALDEMLGAERPDDTVFNALEHFNFQGLSPGAVEQLSRIEEDYVLLESQLSKSLSYVEFPEDREKYDLLKSEKQKDIRAVLAADEYEQYLFRSSVTGDNMRNRLAAFHPSEAEFRLIFPIAKEHEQSIRGKLGSGQSVLRDMERPYVDQAKALLAPERQAAYEASLRPTLGSPGMRIGQ